MSEILSRLTKGHSAILSRRCVVDGCSAVSIFNQLRKDQRYAFLLESVTGGDTRGRYSIIALQPDLIWRCKDGAAEIEEKGAITPVTEAPLESLTQLIEQHQIADKLENLPPMAAGLIGMMGYEMVREVEDLPSDKEGPSGLSDGCFMRPQITLVHDNANDTLTLTTPIWAVDGAYDQTSAEEAIALAEARLDNIAKDIEQLPPLPPVFCESYGEDNIEAYESNVSEEEYKATVEQAKEYIRAGEVFQIVPSIRFTKPFTQDPLAFYRALRHLNPSPYMFFLQLEENFIIGASPEILVRLRDEQVTIRPIAGTRKRGRNEQEDLALEQDLLSDQKEMAEHLMLLDLGRNDVGRVSEGGTVTVTEQMVIERYSHVMHIVSNVTGKRDPRYSALQTLMAGFPAGTVTGAPKIRAMQLLDELEPQRRGFYGGCVGYFSPTGEMDSCITLRTALIKDGKLHLQAGAGVVADSVPQSEYDEVCNKARALMRAAELTKHFEEPR
jgi:anthranilate synthase component 1